MIEAGNIQIPSTIFQRGTSEHNFVADRITKQFGKDVIVSGVDPSCLDTIDERTKTFGVTVDLLRTNMGHDDPLVYASEGDLVVYDIKYLHELPNYQYRVMNPEEAILGRVKLRY